MNALVKGLRNLFDRLPFQAPDGLKTFEVLEVRYE